MLRELVEIGEVDEKFLKEEILKRFKYGDDQLRDFLRIEGFLDECLTREEFWSLFPPEVSNLQEIEKLLNDEFHFVSDPNPVDVGYDLQFSITPEQEYHVVITRTFEVQDYFIDIINLLKNLNIRYLNLSDNQLKILPIEITELPLKYLDLSWNLLESIPPEIAKLPLSHLYLNNNELKSIPTELAELALTDLDLSGNPIEASPEDLKKSKL